MCGGGQGGGFGYELILIVFYVNSTARGKMESLEAVQFSIKPKGIKPVISYCKRGIGHYSKWSL